MYSNLAKVFSEIEIERVPNLHRIGFPPPGDLPFARTIRSNRAVFNSVEGDGANEKLPDPVSL